MIKSFIERIYSVISQLELKKFQLYQYIFFGVCIVLFLLMGFRFYRNVGTLQKKITFINAEREDTVQDIINDIGRIKQEQNSINKILSEDLDFKIAGYFDQVLQKLALSSKVVTINTPSQVDVDETYRESVLQAKLDDMDMKQITLLLQALDENQRISTRQLNIIASKRDQAKLEVEVTIATMLLKSAFETTGGPANE